MAPCSWAGTGWGHGVRGEHPSCKCLSVTLAYAKTVKTDKRCINLPGSDQTSPPPRSLSCGLCPTTDWASWESRPNAVCQAVSSPPAPGWAPSSAHCPLWVPVNTQPCMPGPLGRGAPEHRLAPPAGVTGTPSAVPVQPWPHPGTEEPALWPRTRWSPSCDGVPPLTRQHPGRTWPCPHPTCPAPGALASAHLPAPIPDTTASGREDPNCLPTGLPVFMFPTDSREIFPECKLGPATSLPLTLHKPCRRAACQDTWLQASPPRSPHPRGLFPTTLLPSRPTTAQAGRRCAHLSFGLGVLRTLSSS